MNISLETATSGCLTAFDRALKICGFDRRNNYWWRGWNLTAEEKLSFVGQLFSNMTSKQSGFPLWWADTATKTTAGHGKPSVEMYARWYKASSYCNINVSILWP